MPGAAGGDDRDLGAVERDRLLRVRGSRRDQRKQEQQRAQPARKRKQGLVAEALFRNWWS
ncbi:MAG: hypothetical protein JNM29_21285 [Candidatus Odyssella sp.]|nr:hypothetical protein [Candidatus Odyssella sp.]